MATTLATATPKQIVLAGRNKARISPVIEEINKINASITVTFVTLDLCDNRSIHEAAEKINAVVTQIALLFDGTTSLLTLSHLQQDSQNFFRKTSLPPL